jgi:ribose/xylose/arabinose/galactoside ABC-type transport system permease subunit
VLLCDEPTRGVDVGAKMEIYSHLRRLAGEGMAVLFISSELPEVIGMSDRILVMRGGRISAELSGEAATEEAIVARALGAGAPAGPGGPAGSRGAGPGPALAQPTGAPRAGRPIGTAAARGRLLAPERVVFLSLLALLAAGIFSSGTFLSPYNLTSIVRHAAALGIVAMGQAVVMLAGGVDLSVSATITLTTVLSAGIMAGRDAMILPAVLACLATGLLIGTANGLAVAPLRIPPFIATLGMMSIGRGVVLLITHGPIGAIGPGFRHFARGSIGPVPAALILVVLIFALAALVMGRTPYGKHLFAVGASRETARLAGIRVRRVEISSYLVSGLAAVIGGLYLTSRMSVGDPSVGPGFELDSIIAVLIGGVPFGGGRGKISGVVGGVLLLIVLGNLLNMWNLHSWYHQIARAAILILAISIFRKEE